MKRILVIVGVVVLLIAAAAAAAPFWFGMQAEKAYNNLAQELSSSAAVKTRRYDRGWLSSTAETTVTLSGSPLAFSLTSEIAHGPIAFSRLMQGEFALAPAMAFIDTEVKLLPKKGATQAWLKDFTRRMGALTANTVIGLEGNAETTMDIPPSKSKGKSGASFRSGGMKGTLAFREGGKKVDLELRVPSISLKTPASEFSLKKLIYRFGSGGGPAGYMFGNSTLNVSKLRLGPDLDIRGLTLTTKARPKGANVTTTVDYKVKQIKSGVDEYGPGRLTVVLRKLDAKALQRFNNKLNQISRRGLPEEQASMMMAAEMMKLVATLSKKAPELEVTRLSFKTKEGELTGEAKVVLDGSNLDIAANPFLILRGLSGDAELSVPPSMVKAILAPSIRQDVEAYKRRGVLSPQEAAKLTPAVMSRIVEDAYPSYMARNGFTKLLVPDGSVYRITASFRNGSFLVNGEPVRQPLIQLKAS